MTLKLDGTGAIIGVDQGLNVVGVGTYSTDLNVGGNLNVSGVLTYDDVTNIDSVGVVTARAGVHVTGGNLGVGTNNPFNATGYKSITLAGSTGGAIAFREGATTRWEIYGDNSNGIRFYDRTNTSERLRITSGGDVLIADTTNSIYDDSTGGGMNLKANGQLVLKKEASSTADPLMWLNDTGQTTNKFILFAQDGNEKASIGLAGDDLRFARDGYNETLRITSSGNVGFGTDNPDIYGYGGNLLTVSDSSTYTNLILASSDASNSGISFGGQTLRRSQIQGGNGSDSDLTFLTNPSNSGISVTEKLRITGIGSVGIGQNDPDTLLHLTKNNVNPFNTPVTLLKLHNGGGNQGSTSRIELKTGAATCYIENYIGGPNSNSGADLVFATPSSASVGTERMRIHSDGYVTKSNQPSFFSRPAGGYNLSSGANTIGGTWTDVHDIGSHFSNGTFTAPVAGTYQFTWSAFVQSETTRVDAYILVNGTNVMREEIQGYSATAYNKNGSVHGCYYLSANDAVTFGVYSAAGTQLYVNASPWTYASGFLVG